MFIGYIKGYDFCVVTKKQIEKEDFLSDLIIENPNIKEQIINILDNNGYIIGLEKNKILKVAYLFELNEKVLTFKNKIIAKEIDENTQEKFEKIITEELKEQVCFGDVEKIDWNDIEIESKNSVEFSLSIFAICVALGIIFKNIGMGLLWGAILSISIGKAIVKKKDNSK